MVKRICTHRALIYSKETWRNAKRLCMFNSRNMSEFGDLWFIDHVDLSVDKVLYTVLVLIDAASNLIWASSQKNKVHDTTINTMGEIEREGEQNALAP